MKILFKLATRSRPEKFFDCLKNIIENISDKVNYQILVSYDDDDETMEWEKIKDRLKEFIGGRIILNTGDSKNKIHAINRDLETVPFWDILINTSDDMLFTKQGFDNIIRADMNTYFPGLDGLLHYNDGNQKGNVCTMSIMGRKYYDRFGYIYHPDYKSVWCDVEQTEVAYMLGKHKYLGNENILFKHMHPAFGLAEYDEQYRASENLDVWGEDLTTLLKRKKNNYDLPKEQIVNPFLYSAYTEMKWKRELNQARTNQNLEPINF